jgi:hypothetical protein
MEIATRSGSNEFHMTLRQETESEMRFRKNGIYMGNPRYGDEYLRRIAGKSRIENVISILKAI